MAVQNSSLIEPVFANIIRRHAEEPSWQWLQEKTRDTRTMTRAQELAAVFSAIPSKTGKSFVQLTEEEQKEIHRAHPGFSILNWSLPRLCRVWLLLHTSTGDKEAYRNLIDSLFANAELNELVALYSSLPLLAHPEEWKARCAEGIRTNIGDVLEAIMHNNPYPANYLDEDAWNQMVLKAFFTEKDIDRITGLEQRANLKLALTLSDYASERTAAGRPVNPKLWPLVEKFQVNRSQKI